MNSRLPCFSTLDESKLLFLASGPGDACRLDFRAGPGLYQFSVIADARTFDWEELYIKLHLFGNKGQRTGPWDFNLLDDNKPLVPSYWVALDGRRIGLWFFQRVSLEDLEHRRFRGRMAFHLESDGEHTLEFTPYRPLKIQWISARLEADPEDRLAPLPEGMKQAPGVVPVAAWADPRFWEEQRRRLGSTHAIYREPLMRVFDNVLGKETNSDLDLPLLVAAHFLDRRPQALEKALQTIDRIVDMPAWSNPKEDGYGHNGDMKAAYALRALAWAWHMLSDHLGTERRERLLQKAVRQGHIFFELALLNRDYWGGSVLQDHGRRALIAFVAAVVHLVGVVPEARRWLSYAVHFMERSTRAMPTDGVIPPSSYSNLLMYLDNTIYFREAWLAMTGLDVLDEHPAFRAILDFILKALHGRTQTFLPGHFESFRNYSDFSGGLAFLNLMAAKSRDPRLAYLHQQNLEAVKQALTQSSYSLFLDQDVLWGFLTYDPTVAPAKGLTRPNKDLVHFEDSGYALYRDDRQGAGLKVQCGPWCGYNAYRRAQGPCDRMSAGMDAGHFTLLLEDQPFLVTPVGSYRIDSGARSVLQVDGKGQYGDIGYPMFIPSFLHRGEEIEWTRWDAATATGAIRVKLHPAYPAEMGMILYTREFHVGADRQILCRDHVLFDKPHRLTWLFQVERRTEVVVEDGLRCRIGKTPRIWIEPQPVGVELACRTAETELVWGYSALDRDPYEHIEYESIQPVATASVDFVIRW
ncbi:MAG: hypothetical protein IT578_09155 [Verrucomicrobiae bacterium]|nr:hypothetical protein [Verrucomicrobiae bacterium]